MIKPTAFLGTVALLVISCQALPQGYNEERPEVELVYSRAGTFVGDELPNGEHLPEDCTFISKSETIEGNIKEGEYSYLDPVGSLVVVKYTVGLDGENYTEKRRIVKNHAASTQGSGQVSGTTTTSQTGSSGSFVTAQQIVSRIIIELKPSIISIIRATVQASNINNLDSDNLIKTIIIQLRPVVFGSAQNALSSSAASNLNPGDLTDQILLEITPFVEEGVRKEVTEIQIQTQTQAPKITLTMDQFISTVITNLRPTVIRIISESVASSKVDLTNYQNLVEQIIIRLRPVVLSSVQTTLTGSTVAGDFDAQTLTERIIVELRTFVEEGVQQEVIKIQQQQQLLLQQQQQQLLIQQQQQQQKQQQQLQLQQQQQQQQQQAAAAVAAASAVSEKKIVQTVITQLRPTVIKIIRATVESSNVDLSNYQNLVEDILIKLRPVVLSSVQSAISGSSSYNAESITQLIILELRPFVEEGVQREVTQIQSQNITPTLTEEQIVTLVITKLRPTVIRIITETVSSSNVNLENSDQLVETILIQLRPVVFAAVQNAISSSTTSTNLNANTLSEKISTELRPFIQEGVRKEIVQIQQQNTPTLTADQVVRTVIIQLKPTVIEIIRNAVTSSQLNTDNYDGLVETIIIQLRPVVLSSVQAAISTSTGNWDAQDLTQRIILELRPFVQQGVQREVTQMKQKNQLSEDQVVETVISQLRPTIIRIIQETVKASTNVNFNNQESLTETIVIQLRPVVLQSVKTSISTSSTASHFNAEDLTGKILIRLRPFVQEGVEKQISEVMISQHSLLTEDDVVTMVITQLRPTVISIIQQTVTLESNVNLNNPDSLIETIIVQLRPVVLQSVKSAIATSSTASHFNAEDLTGKIIVQLRPFVREGVVKQISEVNSYQLNSLNEDDVVSNVISDLRPTIITIIRATVESQGGNLNNPEGLVQTITIELRPVVLKSVETALTTSTTSGSFDAEDLTERIIRQLTPFVNEGVKTELTSRANVKQVKKVTTTTDSQSSSTVDGDLVATIVAKLRPVIVQTVKTVYESSSTTSTTGSRPSVRVINAQPTIEVTETRGSTTNEGSLINDIIIKLTPVIQRTVSTAVVQEPAIERTVSVVQQRPVSSQSTVTVQTGFEDQQEGAGYAIETLDTDVEQSLNNDDNVGPSPVQENLIISHAVISLTPSVKSTTRTTVTETTSGDDEEVIEAILDKLMDTILTTLRQEYQDGSYNSDNFDEVLERLVLKLRVIIVQEIRLIRTEQQQTRVEIEQPSLEYGVPLGEPLKPEPEQQQEQEVISKDSIFGLSGKNTVRVETTNYNYQYGSES